MLTASFVKLNAYTPNEMTGLLLPKHYKTPSTQRAVIALHGRNGDFQVGLPGWQGGNHTAYLAHNGYAVFSIGAGGGQTWNNTTAMTAITAAYDWLVSRGMVSTKIGLWAWSMGGGNALQWIKENPTKVSCAQLWAPMTDLPYFYNQAGNTAEIEAAYGGNYATNSVGRRISDEYPTWRDKCPIMLVHGDADNSAPLSKSQAFVSGVNQSQVTLTTVSNADHSTVFSGVSVDTTLAFFDGGSW